MRKYLLFVIFFVYALLLSEGVSFAVTSAWYSMGVSPGITYANQKVVVRYSVATSTGAYCNELFASSNVDETHTPSFGNATSSVTAWFTMPLLLDGSGVGQVSLYYTWSGASAPTISYSSFSVVPAGFQSPSGGGGGSSGPTAEDLYGGYMSLAGIICAGLLWFGIIKAVG